MSKIIFLAAEGVPNYKISQQLDMNINKVGRWRNRFAELGMAGLEKDLARDANEARKNPKEQERIRSQIIKVTATENLIMQRIGLPGA